MRGSTGSLQVGASAASNRFVALRTKMKHLAAAGAGLVLAALLVSRLIQVDRGIDLTDEMMYLLAASAGPTEFIHSMWGWHTAPLLTVAQGDVATFRSLGVLILALAAVVGALAARATVGGASTSLQPKWQSYVETLLLAIGATFWSSLFYVGMLRSPGHNWVAVVGLTVAGAGLIVIFSPRSNGLGWVGPLFLVAGCAFAFPARPLSVIPVAVAVLARVGQLWREGHGQQLLNRTAGSAIGFAASALAVGVWPLSIVNDFVRAADTPALVEGSTILGALLNYSTFPIVWARSGAFMALANPAIGLLMLALFVTALGMRWSGIGRRGAVRPAARFALAAAPTLAIMSAGLAFSLRPSLGGLGSASRAWGTIAVGSVVLAGALSALFGSSASWKKPLQIGLLFVALAAATGIGTAGNLIGISANAIGLVGLALLVIARGNVETRTEQVLISAVWSVAGAVLAIALLSASTAQPYRMEEFSQQNQKVSVLSGSLYVDGMTAARLEELRELSDQSGFMPGDRLITVTLPWSSFAPIAIDAARMPSLMPTVFGYSGTAAMAEFNLSLLNRGWPDAWVIIDSARDSESYQERGQQVRAVEKMIELATGREFPADYTCVAAGEHYQFWFPARSESPVCAYSAPTPDSS